MSLVVRGLTEGDAPAGGRVLCHGFGCGVPRRDKPARGCRGSVHALAHWAAADAATRAKPHDRADHRGFPPKQIDCITGVCKAFSSAVGDGPFPTEMPETDAALFRGTGANPDDEYGARTGRSRRIGWLDLPILRYANAINGFDELVLTKLDKLDTLPEIKVCTHYTLDGRILERMPNTSDLYRVEPVYETMRGWLKDTTCCNAFDELPENAKKYVQRISEAIGVPIRYIGNGPSRENTILV